MLLTMHESFDFSTFSLLFVNNCFAYSSHSEWGEDEICIVLTFILIAKNDKHLLRWSYPFYIASFENSVYIHRIFFFYLVPL